ncbi:MAG: transporter substrate-binding domain-containing protein [Muribaculaceae bacterium]|nr:transporter substrate-binding domain-containing protein [Muribaculaceae bacterium]
MERLKLKKGHIILYLALLAGVFVIMFFTRNLSRKGFAEAGSPHVADSLKVAIQISPIGVSTHGDTLGGFYYDMIRQMAAREHLALKIEGFTQVTNALDNLENGKYDIVISDIPITSELRDRYLFTNPIYADRQTLVQLADSVTGLPPIRTQSDLRGDTVYIAAQSPFLSRLRNLSRELGDTIYVFQDRHYGPEQMMLLTAIGQLKNVVVNEQTARNIAKDYPQLDISVTLSFNQFQSWAVAPEKPRLLDSLNVWIARFKSTPQFEKLVDRYFNEKPVKM